MDTKHALVPVKNVDGELERILNYLPENERTAKNLAAFHDAIQTGMESVKRRHDEKEENYFNSLIVDDDNLHSRFLGLSWKQSSLELAKSTQFRECNGDPLLEKMAHVKTSLAGLDIELTMLEGRAKHTKNDQQEGAMIRNQIEFLQNRIKTQTEELAAIEQENTRTIREFAKEKKAQAKAATSKAEREAAIEKEKKIRAEIATVKAEQELMKSHSAPAANQRDMKGCSQNLTAVAKKWYPVGADRTVIRAIRAWDRAVVDEVQKNDPDFVPHFATGGRLLLPKDPLKLDTILKKAPITIKALKAACEKNSSPFDPPPSLHAPVLIKRQKRSLATQSPPQNSSIKKHKTAK